MNLPFFFSLTLFAGFPSAAIAATSTDQQVTVSNFDRHGIPCVANLTKNNAQCTSEGCNIELPKKRPAQHVKLNFNCIPISALTGFENPPPDVRIESVRSKNSQGHLSVVEDTQLPPSERMQELNFCLWGRVNIFCGYAKVPSLADDPKSDQIKAIKTVIKSVELRDPLVHK
jgi:hypothetical protein